MAIGGGLIALSSHGGGGKAGAGAGAAGGVTFPAAPAGRLAFLSSGVETVKYLALDDLARPAAGVVEATVLEVGKQPAYFDSAYPIQVKRETIACAGRTITNERASLTDLDGAVQSTKMLSGPAGRAASGLDPEVDAVCGTAAPHPPTLTGFRAVVHRAVQPPPEMENTVRGKADDADGWAWLCASEVRGRWSQTVEADCDHALKLAPGDMALAVDRAYLALNLNRMADADARFQAILAKDPKSAEAWMGRGLIAAIKGDEAKSAELRGHAFDSDPKIGVWVMSNYRLQIPQQYMER